MPSCSDFGLTIKKMKLMLKISILTFVLALVLAAPALAVEEVRVFQPKMVEAEEPGKELVELTPLQLRQKTLLLAFSEAAVQTAQAMSAEPLGKDRLNALRTYFKPRASEWILGYKELSSRLSENGLSMLLEVDVNRRVLRQVVASLGLDKPTSDTLRFSLIPLPTLLEADKVALSSIMLLVNAKESPGIQPQLTLGRMENGTLRGSLDSDRGFWSAMDVDMTTIWFALWDRYYLEGRAAEAGSAGVLEVSGWFTPDGANDFDRVLSGWDDLLRSSKLVELDLLTAGVTARWEVDPVDLKSFKQRLSGYLPQRGLSYDVNGVD